MRELLQEILASIRRNKLRTFLTGFSVAWGIFMLIVLLGSGNGLKNGVMSNFNSESRNSIQIGGGRTSMPYKGYQRGRRIRLEVGDAEAMRRQFPDNITDVAMTVYGPGVQMARGREYMSAAIEGATPRYLEIEGMKMLKGRFINSTDMDERRKVAVLDNISVKALFKDEDPLGQMVQINNMGHVVVGVYEAVSYWGSSIAYLPMTTMQGVFLGGDRRISEMSLILEGVGTTRALEKFTGDLRTLLSARHSFDPTDRRAVWIWNRIEDYRNTMMIFNGISMFIWIIGIGTLMAGIVGVSNIMLVTVRERTSEFGIRKALGAKPGNIVRMVLVESVMITAVFGYVGMVSGIGLMEVVNLVVERMNGGVESDMVMFLDPTLDLSTAVSATLVLVLSGMMAGYVPARRASTIKAIDAMRFNK